MSDAKRSPGSRSLALSVPRRVTLFFGVLWLLTLGAAGLSLLSDRFILWPLVVAALATLAWGAILEAQRRVGWLAGSLPLGAGAFLVIPVAATYDDECSECYTGLAVAAVFGLLVLLLAVGGLIGDAWRALKRHRSG